MKTGGVTGHQQGREGTTNQPHSHTTQTFSSTRHTSDRVSADKMSRTSRPQQQSREEDSKDQGAEYTWSSWLWGARKSRRAEPQPTGAPPPQGYNTNTTIPLFFGEEFTWYTTDLLRLQGDRILREKRRRGWTGDHLMGPYRVYPVHGAGSGRLCEGTGRKDMGA